MVFFMAAKEIGEACMATLSLIFFFREILKYVMIVIPLGLVLMMTIDFFRGVISIDDQEKVTKYVTKRVVYTIVIFFMPET